MNTLQGRRIIPEGEWMRMWVVFPDRAVRLTALLEQRFLAGGPVFMVEDLTIRWDTEIEVSTARAPDGLLHDFRRIVDKQAIPRSLPESGETDEPLQGPRDYLGRLVNYRGEEVDGVWLP